MSENKFNTPDGQIPGTETNPTTIQTNTSDSAPKPTSFIRRTANGIFWTGLVGTISSFTAVGGDSLFNQGKYTQEILKQIKIGADKLPFEVAVRPKTVNNDPSFNSKPNQSNVENPNEETGKESEESNRNLSSEINAEIATIENAKVEYANLMKVKGTLDQTVKTIKMQEAITANELAITQVSNFITEHRTILKTLRGQKKSVETTETTPVATKPAENETEIPVPTPKRKEVKPLSQVQNEYNEDMKRFRVIDAPYQNKATEVNALKLLPSKATNSNKKSLLNLKIDKLQKEINHLGKERDQINQRQAERHLLGVNAKTNF